MNNLHNKAPTALVLTHHSPLSCSNSAIAIRSEIAWRSRNVLLSHSGDSVV